MKKNSSKCKRIAMILLAAAMVVQSGMVIYAEELSDADLPEVAEYETEQTEAEWIVEEQDEEECLTQEAAAQIAEAQADVEWVLPYEEPVWAVEEEWLLPEAIYTAEPAQTPDETKEAFELIYENEKFVVKLTVGEGTALPENTEVKVTKLETGSAEYLESKKAVESSALAEENTVYTFYKVVLMAEGKELDLPEGAVSIQMELKADTVTDVLGIETTESGKVAHDLTDAMTAENGVRSLEVTY